MILRPATTHDVASMADLAARLQADPTASIVYLGDEREGIEAELGDVDCESVSMLALDGDLLVGWLVGDVNEEVGRVHWLGPFVATDDWHLVATQLYQACAELLPADVDEEEIAIDDRFQRFERWAATHGFVRGDGSVALVLDVDIAGPVLEVRPIVDDDLESVSTLHEELFPGTHTTGSQLVMDRDEHHVRLVTEIDGALAGYVAYELQPDGAGYIDFLGVAPDSRRRGLGAQLVRASVAGLRGLAADPIHLTVRQDGVAARALYASLGFREERVLCPLRKGFALT